MFSITDYVSAVQIFLTGLPEVLMRLEKKLQKPKKKQKPSWSCYGSERKEGGPVLWNGI